MTFFRDLRCSPRALLNSFIYGSTFFLLICLFVMAYIFSDTYLSKQKVRLEESKDLISDFFDFQYRAISEEMWTENYASIRSRVAEIARQLSHASYDLVLADETGKCRAAFLDQQRNSPENGKANSQCIVPKELAERIGTFRSDSIRAFTRFDETRDRYLYIVPLFVGTVLKGYLYASISDPYGFCAENSVLLVMRLFFGPIMVILALWFAWLLFAKTAILKPYFETFIKMEKKEALGNLAGTVAHNIRSPLVVINSTVRTLQGNDQQKKLLIAVATRMENIANELITHYQGKSVPKGTEAMCFLLPVVDSIRVEKQEMLKDCNVEIHTDFTDMPSASVVPLKGSDLAVVLSNLLNNAIEACRGQDRRGEIKLSVHRSGDRQIAISIADNGKGMPSQILQRINTTGGTFGKEGGSGIGLQHAKRTITESGGNLSITSNEGFGTQIEIHVPLVSLPPWCPKGLDLTSFKQIVVLDDDPAMRLLWEQRLLGIKTILLSNPTQFDVSKYSDDSTFFIFDHDFGPLNITGLELIRRNQIGSRTVLVTSHFESPEIQQGVTEAGARLLPKFLVSQIDLALPEQGAQPRQIDLVLVDDDKMMHELWEFEAMQLGKRLRVATTADELDWSLIPKETPIYVDKNLENGVCCKISSMGAR